MAALQARLRKCLQPSGRSSRSPRARPAAIFPATPSAASPMRLRTLEAADFARWLMGCGRAETGRGGYATGCPETPPPATLPKSSASHDAIRCPKPPLKTCSTQRWRSAKPPPRSRCSISARRSRWRTSPTKPLSPSPTARRRRISGAPSKSASRRHGIFGEEFGRSGGGADHTWIIDPIDGTRSFICGIPLFGMLLGVLAGGDPVAGRDPHAGARTKSSPAAAAAAPRRTARRSAAARRRGSKRHASSSTRPTAC